MHTYIASRFFQQLSALVHSPYRGHLRNPTICLFCEPSLRAGHGGENPYIDPEDVLKLLIVGDSAVRLLVTLGVRSAW